MSFGAFGGRADIMAQFDPSQPNALPHAGTFNNNTLTMTAGVVGLMEIYTPEVCVAHNARGEITLPAGTLAVPVLVAGLHGVAAQVGKLSR